MNVLFRVKVFVSALVIAAAVEAAKRDPYWGAVIIALPLTSVLGAGCTSIRATILPGAKLGELQFARRVRTRDGPSHNVLVTRFARDIF